MAESSHKMPQVAVVQDGARLHYAVPVALERAGLLKAVFTEWYIRPGSALGAATRVAARFSARARRARERRHPEIPARKVYTNIMVLVRRVIESRKHTYGETLFAWSSERNYEWVRRKKMGGADAIFGFVRNISPNLCAWAQARGARVVTDQMIAPMVEEERQARLQQERFPGWQQMTSCIHADLVSGIERRTWAASDHVTCASDYVRKGLLSEGVPDPKISVLPYPIDASHYTVVDRRNRPGPVTVGFVGAVGLRKGAPYFFEVAKRLAGEKIRFVMVGPVHLNGDVARRECGPVELIGGVPRSQVGAWLGRFDVLLFPSTCEGSPGSVMEAMATGLPIVSTPTSGTVVREGEEGYVAPYDDVDALAAAVERLASDAGLRHAMGQSARKRAETFNLDGYSAGLGGLYRRLAGG